MTENGAADPLLEQVQAGVAGAVNALDAFVGPDGMVAIAEIRKIAERTAARYAVLLRQDDDREVAECVIDLVCLLFPQEAQIPDEWWSTPLGRVAAASTGHPYAEAVTFSVAAAMLGETPDVVNAMAASGDLDGHPDGTITSVSVQQYLEKRRQR
ncbi:hypothetical protein ACWCPT_29405 [Streptomyces sp. NPDC002308]